MHFDEGFTSYLYNGTDWVLISDSSSTSTPTLGQFSFPTTTIFPDPSKSLKPKDEELGLPERSVYIAREISKHKMTITSGVIRNEKEETHTSCVCSVLDKYIEWERHLADVAVAASDEWDQLIMGQDTEE